MDKNVIKKYAIWARNELITRVAQRALKYGIEDGKSVDKNLTSFHDYVFSDIENSQRKKLCQKIEEQGYQNTIEEIAYTWFNRFCAIRFMEVNGYLPSHVRVLSDDDDRFNPQIIGESINLDFVDLEYVYKLRENNKNEELYRYLLIMQCNELSKILPEMFQKIDDYTELLLPDYLLRDESVLKAMVEQIPQEDWTEQVQILGWMYQYYNTEPKDKVFADLKKNVKITKESIPAATQLFTPDWIVRYMVENSLGRLWVESHDGFDCSEWKYFLEEAQQEESVQDELKKIRVEYHGISPEDIRFIDPCMGSGHVLVYAFEVLMQIYESAGYSARDAASLIVSKNLYGIDLDLRAFQLAYFAIMMMGRKYDRRFLTKGITPNLSDMQGISLTGIDYLEGTLSDFAQQFHNCDCYGSLLPLGEFDVQAIENEILAYEKTFFFERETLEKMLKIYKILSQKYDVVVTNPPYMGGSGMNGVLSDFVKKNYKDYKSDLFSAFVVRCTELTKKDGYLGFLTPYVWMFIQSYEKMRQYIYTGKTIETLIQFEYSAFQEATVPICTFVLKNSHVNKNGCYLRLTDFKGGMEVQRQKTLEAIRNHNCGFYFEANSENFSKIPGSPVAYWVSENFIRAFENKKLGELIPVKKGMDTGNNEYFLKLWFESNIQTIDFINHSKKWIPYDKGGNFRKWFGNNEYILNWGKDGFELKNSKANLRSKHLYFKPSITWNALSSANTCFRYSIFNGSFDSAGSSIFPNNETMYYYLGILNSTHTQYFLNVINPTLNYGAGSMAQLPIIIDEPQKSKIDSLVEENIAISKTDWDSFETSWDFEGHPLV